MRNMRRRIDNNVENIFIRFWEEFEKIWWTYSNKMRLTITTNAIQKHRIHSRESESAIAISCMTSFSECTPSFVNHDENPTKPTIEFCVDLTYMWHQSAGFKSWKLNKQLWSHVWRRFCNAQTRFLKHHKDPTNPTIENNKNVCDSR